MTTPYIMRVWCALQHHSAMACGLWKMSKTAHNATGRITATITPNSANFTLSKPRQLPHGLGVNVSADTQPMRLTHDGGRRLRCGAKKKMWRLKRHFIQTCPPTVKERNMSQALCRKQHALQTLFSNRLYRTLSCLNNTGVANRGLQVESSLQKWPKPGFKLNDPFLLPVCQ